MVNLANQATLTAHLLTLTQVLVARFTHLRHGTLLFIAIPRL